MRKKSFEEYLIKQNLLPPEKVESLLAECKSSGETLRERVSRNNLIPQPELLNYYQHVLGIPYVDPNKFMVDQKLLNLFSREFLRSHLFLPLFSDKTALHIVMHDPLDILLIDEIKLKTGLPVEVSVAFESEILQALDRNLGATASLDELVKNTDLAQFSAEEEIEVTKLQSLAEEAPVVKMIDLIVMQAMHDRASDIHIEPEEAVVKVRFRVDGVLHEVSALPKHFQSAVISRIKIMSNLDIAEKRIPQDGRFKFFTEGSAIDMRVSTFPTIYGENIVMRILQTKNILLSLEQLGFQPQVFSRFKELINRPHGIVLVTGPTGSGKTTTLYSVLNTLNSPEKNIITVEDPVEYRLPGIRQSQINPKAGLTFAAGLRSILRQDPDIILVGEIRDFETVEVAVHAAMTGHLVFSTLHTNDAPGAVTRLVDMGVEPYLMVSTLNAVIAQRLVRKICEHCKASYPLEASVLAELNLAPQKEPVNVYKGKGCPQCYGTGYKGRIGIFELMVMTDAIRQAIINKLPALEIAKIAYQEGMQSLREDGIQKVLAGMTTLEEVLRVTAEE